MCQVVAAADEADGAAGEPRAAKAPRLDPAVELEALRRRVHALELENERLRGAAAGVLDAAAAARSSPSSSEGTVDAPRPLRGHGLRGAQIRCRPSHDVGTIVARCEAFDPCRPPRVFRFVISDRSLRHRQIPSLSVSFTSFIP